MLRGRKFRIAASLLVLALVGAACSGRDDDNERRRTKAPPRRTAPPSRHRHRRLRRRSHGRDRGQRDQAGVELPAVRCHRRSRRSPGAGRRTSRWSTTGRRRDRRQHLHHRVRGQGRPVQPGQTVANIDELVGPDGANAFAVFSVVGTANNLAIRDQLGELCVPNLFAATGSPDHGAIGLPVDGGLVAVALLARGQGVRRPAGRGEARRQGGDAGPGRRLRQGLRGGLQGRHRGHRHRGRQGRALPTGATEVSAQITSLAATGADAFFNGGTLLACPDALTKGAAASWTPITWVSATCTSKTLMGMAGLARQRRVQLHQPQGPAEPGLGIDDRR